MSDTHLSCNDQTLKLSRYPLDRTENLRAWDAADELIIDWCSEHLGENSPWIFNDQFGTLGTWLNSASPSIISDSFLAKKALSINLGANDIDDNSVSFINSPELPSGSPSIVLMKIPKNLALFEYQLQQLTRSCKTGTQIVAGAMLKHLPSRAFDLLNTYIGDTTTSLAKKKARLIFATLDDRALNSELSYPTSYITPKTNLRFSNHANVFSRESIDIGTRFFLDHLPQCVPGEKVIDLACGNGILGIHLALQEPLIDLGFYDESYMALSSARDNCQNLLSESTKARFVADNCLESALDNSADLIVNNPPFHQGQVVGDHLAWQMFKDAYRVLTTKGRLIIVGNRHLGYHVKLKKIFGNAKQLASNNKFVIIEARKL